MNSRVLPAVLDADNEEATTDTVPVVGRSADKVDAPAMASGTPARAATPAAAYRIVNLFARRWRAIASPKMTNLGTFRRRDRTSAGTTKTSEIADSGLEKEHHYSPERRTGGP